MTLHLRAHMFDELVKAAGGQPAAMAAIEAAVGHSVSSASLSRIQNGNSEPPYSWVCALENATRRYPFSNMRSRELSGLPMKSGLACHLDMLREATEGVTALAAYEAAPEDPQAIARAYAELDDVHRLTGDAMAALKTKMGVRGGAV
ncbi:hypothetical protein [Pararhodobacter zhoushanensis]|uniref:hypothetical protein n=1 Tax=Pararhodobacter zhoushanensis TaxID=2479545 RepID=UPI000F8CD0D2|nr:hypothetical protein [Pararhodobacter zhoushanensis]